MPFTTVLELNHDGDNFPADDVLAASEFGIKAATFLKAGVAGSRALNSVVRRGHATPASGTLTLSSASGTVGGTINGTTVTVTASGGDTATAAALATAINTNATVNKLVVATSSGAVVTLTAIGSGYLGNCCTLVASGTGVTASGAKLAGGSADADVTYKP